MPSDCSESANKIYCKPFLTGYSPFTGNNDVFPLWSSKRFHKEYLQVEVYADKEVPLEKSTDDVLNMDTYFCYICDINVPKSYMTEHNEGNKHKTSLKIIDLALERTRKQMSVSVKEPKLSIHVTESYFCEQCALVVLKKDKNSHELSLEHENSLKRDDIIDMFFKIYADKDNLDLVGTFDCNSDIIISEIENENEKITEEIKIVDPDTSEESREMDSQLVPEEILEQVPKPDLRREPERTAKPSKKSLKHVEHRISKETKSSQMSQLTEYLKTVSEKSTTYPLHTVEASTDKLVLITAINGDKVKVSLGNFHSYHNQKDTCYCKICEQPNVEYNHEYSEEHMEKVMIPIVDKNAIRKIDDIWSHCILCNDLTKNTTFHLQSLLHRNKLKHSLIDSSTDINQNIVHRSTSQLIQEHSLIETNSQEVACNICNLTILNNVMSIESHIKTFDHVTNYNTTIELNELHDIDDNQFYCTPCDVCVSKSQALGHCNGKKHNKNHTEFIKKMTANDEVDECTQVILPSISQQIKRTKKSVKTDSDLICFVCNITLFNVDKHMNGLEHKRNYFSYLESNKLNEIEEDTFFCIPCNTVILIDYLMSHCSSKKHKTHLKNFMNNTLDNKNPNVQLLGNNPHITSSIEQNKQNVKLMSTEIPSLNSVFDTAIPLKFIYQYRELSNNRNLLCTICDEEVPFRKYDVQSHVNLIDHVVAFNLLMLWNKIKRLNDKYYCDVCKIDVTYFNELTHIQSANHVDVMSNLQKGTVYEYDKKLLTIEYAMSHKIGDRVRPSSLISVVKAKET